MREDNLTAMLRDRGPDRRACLPFRIKSSVRGI
jgi:hypothetical protein